MFRKYGLLGLGLIIIAEISIFFKINLILEYFFPIVWWGYILLIDAIIYKLKGNSFLSNRFKTFLVLFFISAPLWFLFDVYNLFFYSNWKYIVNIPLWVQPLFGLISFGIVFPAIFETAEFLRTIYLKKHHTKIHKKLRINKTFLFSIISIGIVFLIIPFIFPKSPLALLGWIGFFLLLDPINYMHNEPSIIGYIKKYNIIVPLSYFIAGYICGFLWEFWNYWAKTKWYYSVPYLGPKIFEMPILGYLAYGFFALELFAMYYFIRTLRKEVILVEKEILKKVENKVLKS